MFLYLFFFFFTFIKYHLIIRVHIVRAGNAFLDTYRINKGSKKTFSRTKRTKKTRELPTANLITP